ncbi:hypothetical protein OPS25_10800 [Alteromonas ponticola]|uniref:Uncharacterized protein n=2 Tax=Alteromonas aquimaris TaxID=2998417 RepID=A0ABT3P892_9ALTE|nr:hypothetical protein [Alteromonas aquimaris]
MNAAGVAVAWIGSVIGPLFIFSTFGDFTHPNTYIGAALILVVLLSIKDGIKARKNRNMSGFVAMCLVPSILPFIVIVSFYIFWSRQ